MKKLLSVLLCATLVLSLAACSSNDDATQDDTAVDGDITETEIVTPESNEDAELETPNLTEPTLGDAVAALPDDDFTANPVSPETVPDPTTSEVTPEVAPEVTPEVVPEATPEVTPEVAPEVTAPAADATAQGAFDAIIAANAEFPANMLVEGEFLDMTYAGLAAASTDFVVYMPMMSAVAAEIAIAKTDGTSTVADLFQARIDYQIESGAFYPETTEGWQSNSHIVTAGDYVMLLACPAGETAYAQGIIDLFTATFA